MKRAFFVLFSLLAASGTGAAPPEGYRAIESAAASVNGEVLFLSDVEREACCYRCGIVPGLPAREMTLARAREMLVADTLVLQEAKKLGLEGVDNTALASAAAEALSRARKCESPCARSLGEPEVRDLLRRRMLVREFLEQRVAVFIEVDDEEVRKEIEQRSRAGALPEELSEEKVRKRLYEEEAASEIRNWFSRTTSKSRIVLSPLSEP